MTTLNTVMASTPANFVMVSKFLPKVAGTMTTDWAAVTDAHLNLAEKELGAGLGEIRDAIVRKRADAKLTGGKPASVATKQEVKAKVVLTDEEVCLAAGLPLAMFLSLPAEAQTMMRSGAKQAEKKVLKVKVSEKGAISVYGLNAQFPTTLYANQWERLIESIDLIKNFLAENANNPAVSREKSK